MAGRAVSLGGTTNEYEFSRVGVPFGKAGGLNRPHILNSSFSIHYSKSVCNAGKPVVELWLKEFFTMFTNSKHSLELRLPLLLLLEERSSVVPRILIR